MMEKSDIFWQTYLNLEKETIELSKYIFFTDVKLISGSSGIVTQPCNSQLETFSPHIAVYKLRLYQKNYILISAELKKEETKTFFLMKTV